MENERVRVTPKDLTLDAIKRDYARGRIDPNPDYQREYVYSDKQASKLIESALMMIPIPTIYLCEEAEGKLSIIDGQQRIMSFIRFLNNEFALTGLQNFKDLNNKKFKDLDEETQSFLEYFSLRTIVIEKESQEMKYEIFARLNQGAVKLRPQELRNCIFRGSFNNMLKEIAKTNKHLNVLFWGENKRMNYEENILRFFALRNYMDYKSSMKETMNQFMSVNQNCNEKQIIDYKKKFVDTIDIVKQVLGEYAFCGYDRKSGSLIKKFSGSIYDSIIIPFSFFSKNLLMKNADAVRKSIDYIKKNDPDYLDYTYAATGSRDRVIGRITKILNKLQDILGPGAMNKEERCFSNEFKQSLFEKNKVCAICGNEILSIDDAEVDHIDPFSKGGLTTEANAQLVHRYCNRSKSDNIDDEEDENND